MTTKPQKTQRMRAPARREHIITNARQIFARAGYENASLDDIAGAAGVSKPIVYRHFDGKRALYLAVLSDHMTDLISRLWVALSSSPDPRQRLHAGLSTYFVWVEEREDGFRLITEASTRLDPEVKAALGSNWDTIAEGIARTVADLLLAAGLDPAGAPVYARALLGMAQAVADWWVRSLDRSTVEELVDYLLALVWRGFDGLPRHPTKFRQITVPTKS